MATLPVPVIMCGGSGTRLWPASTMARPKQFIALTEPRSLLAATFHRVSDPSTFQRPIVISGESQTEDVRRAAQENGETAFDLILEPFGRNTAPAVVAAALVAAQQDPEAVIVILPADHVVRDGEAFGKAIRRAVDAAQRGHIVTLGIVPDRPETGYGYIRAGEETIQGLEAVHGIDRFVEKPDEETAIGYIREGGYYWNAGIFVVRADVMIGEAGRWAPEVLDAVRAALTPGSDGFRLDAQAFDRSPSVSVDVAIMEKTDRGAVVPVDMKWSDVGSWAAVYQERLDEADAAGNVAPDGTVLIDTQNCFVHGEGGPVALVGVEGLAVIRSGDALLICPLDRTQEVKTVADTLVRRER